MACGTNQSQQHTSVYDVLCLFLLPLYTYFVHFISTSHQHKLRSGRASACVERRAQLPLSSDYQAYYFFPSENTYNVSGLHLPILHDIVQHQHTGTDKLWPHPYTTGFQCLAAFYTTALALPLRVVGAHANHTVLQQNKCSLPCFTTVVCMLRCTSLACKL